MGKFKRGDKVRFKEQHTKETIYEFIEYTAFGCMIMEYEKSKHVLYTYARLLELVEENIMPELIPGKHIVVDDQGKKYLVLADGIFVLFEGNYWNNIRGKGWFTKKDINIVEVYEININLQRSDCKAEDSSYNNLIWSKEDSNKESIKQEYSELMDKIKDLQKKAEDIKGKL